MMQQFTTKSGRRLLSGAFQTLPVKHSRYTLPLLAALTVLIYCNTMLGSTRPPQTSGFGSTSSGSGSGSSSASGTSDSAAQSCTLYVASNGSARNSGTTPASAITLLQAAAVAVAGDTVCIAPGTYSLASTFYPAHSGNANYWITYTSYDSGTVNIVWTAGANASDQTMFHMYNAKFPEGPSYIEFKGLTLNGQNVAESGFFCQGSHHLRYLQNTIENMGSSGIGSMDCDYQTADHNIVYHNGYRAGWSSGISYNSNQWLDTYSGLHNIVSNNIVAGSFDGSSNHTDGNGIIMDLSNGTYTAASANTPPALIVNNVVYGNGGRCIENDYVTNIWIVNNTCYDNGLDLTLGNVGEIVSVNASHEFFVNNIVQAWDKKPAFMEQGVGSSLTFSSNMIYGSPNSGIAAITNSDPEDFTTENPDFVSPPAYNATAGGQYANTINPLSLGKDLNLQSDSRAIDAGIDPTSLAGSNTSLKSDMSTYIYTDINGNPRTPGSRFTLGAYQP
jgi:hypothetical protein